MKYILTAQILDNLAFASHCRRSKLAEMLIADGKAKSFNQAGKAVAALTDEQVQGELSRINQKFGK